MERLSEYLEEKNSTRKVGGDRKEKKKIVKETKREAIYFQEGVFQAREMVL